jgi:N-acetylneuraminic acid mutarotase
MKKLFILLTLSLSLSLVKADFWTQRASFPGTNRDGCFSFSIGNKGYIGCGYDTNWTCTRKFWEYDKATNSWSQKADYPDSARIYAIGFTIGNFGYAGTGVSPAGGWFDDFWKYDPLTNTWTQIAAFGGGPRSEACAFVINNKGYVGTGTGTVSPYVFDDLWQYDPVSNVWTSKAFLPGFPRVKAMGFASGNFGYIATGYNVSTYYSDLWQYNSVTDTWLPKTSFPADPRGGTAGFSLNGELFFGTGNNQPISGGLYASKDWWVYNINLNQWAPKASFSGSSRYETGFFTIGPSGYVGLGLNANVMYNDFWQYTPDIPSGINELPVSDLRFTVSPNPAKDVLVIESANKNLEITFRDVSGKIIYSHQPETKNQKPETTINVSSFPQGLYFVELSDGKTQSVEKFVKE